MAIRVLHVVTSMDAGGIETMLMNIHRTIDREKVQFDYLVHRDCKGFYEDEIASLGGKIYRAMPVNLGHLPFYTSKLYRFFCEHPEYTIVHSHISYLSYLVLKIAKKARIATRIAHSHQSGNVGGLKRLPVRLYCKAFINKQATHRFACSRDAGTWLFGNKAEFRVVHNAIDIQKFIFNSESRHDKRNELGVRDKFVIGHIGNFSPVKNYPFIIDIFESLCREDKDAVLLLIGKKENNPEVEKLLKALDLSDRSILTGVREDVPALLHAMDVFLFPSISEGLGLALVEAQASGLKCFVSDSITRDVKITDNVIFKSLDEPPEEWARCIARCSRNYQRDTTYQAICGSGYDVRQSAKELSDFYLAVYRGSYPV